MANVLANCWLGLTGPEDDAPRQRHQGDGPGQGVAPVRFSSARRIPRRLAAITLTPLTPKRPAGRGGVGSTTGASAVWAGADLAAPRLGSPAHPCRSPARVPRSMITPRHDARSCGQATACRRWPPNGLARKPFGSAPASSEPTLTCQPGLPYTPELQVPAVALPVPATATQSPALQWLSPVRGWLRCQAARQAAPYPQLPAAALALPAALPARDQGRPWNGCRCRRSLLVPLNRFGRSPVKVTPRYLFGGWRRRGNRAIGTKRPPVGSAERKHCPAPHAGLQRGPRRRTRFRRAWAASNPYDPPHTVGGPAPERNLVINTFCAPDLSPHAPRPAHASAACSGRSAQTSASMRRQQPSR